jgi:hypothetical protein
VVELLDVSVDVDGVSANDQRALRLGIDVSVRAIERRHQEQTALKRTGIASGRGGDVQLGSGSGERRQRSRHEHCREVLHTDGRSGHADTHAEKHGSKRLGREGGLLRVARAGETDHQAVAGELVVADPFDGRDVFDAGPALSRDDRGTDPG